MIYGDPIILGGGGGGLADGSALLSVTVPAESTVTATKNGATVTPSLWLLGTDASTEVALFAFTPAQFDSATPWTITATLGEDSASDTVLITTNKEYEIVLSYAYYFYKNGTSYNGFSPTSTFKNSVFTITQNANTIGLRATDTGRNGIAWSLQFNNNGYSKLSAVIESGTILKTNVPYFGIYSGSGDVYNETNFTAKSLIDTTLPTTVSVDVSSVSGGYIAFRLHSGSEIQVSKIYLSD